MYMAIYPKTGRAHVAVVAEGFLREADRLMGKPIPKRAVAHLLCSNADATGFLLSDGQFADPLCERCQTSVARGIPWRVKKHPQNRQP